MPWDGFEPTILAFERAKTVHALDRAATVIGLVQYLLKWIQKDNGRQCTDKTQYVVERTIRSLQLAGAYNLRERNPFEFTITLQVGPSLCLFSLPNCRCLKSLHLFGTLRILKFLTCYKHSQIWWTVINTRILGPVHEPGCFIVS
jgi:hypothetical protein